ncbi:Ectonucleotide pyrophosphatase/phosphodiesterase family member 5 [Orchesella cincta]|uniref:Ectonucleotide pyrophosphatase/phosphodiesterase family member 5 n=1 Tax=Orchesella cincta TaxID=48709 RepID=A0A1D2MUW1_ORCCI|nr:Ectonucleotide pyrophosphatase/phosphodiesterase family member 5 [Orchesella cincta]
MYLRRIISVFIAVTLLGNVISVPLNKLSEHPVILVVSFDGFRHDYLTKVDTPALHELKNDGASVPYMEPVFPTMTFPNHQSIATGLYAESHGVVDNEFFDPEFNKVLSGFDDDEGFWNYHPDVLPIWLRNEMAGEGRTSGCLMWPGSSEPYGPNNDLRPTYYYPGYNASVTWEERVYTVISWINHDTKPANLVFMYFNEPDSQGHGHGPNHNVTLQEIRKADNRTAHLVNKLKEADIFEKINLIMLSDHGMQEVTSQTIVNISQLIDNSLVEAQYGGTPILQLVPKEGKEEELYTKLSTHSKTNNFTIWKKEQMEYRLRYSKSRRIQDYIVVADPGYAFDDFYSSMEYYNDKYNLTAGPETEYGVHGYNPETLSMKPFFIAHGPAFLKGMEFQPIRNIDVVPMISTILQIPAVPSNGSLLRVAEMINPTFIPGDNSGGNGLTGNLVPLHYFILLIGSLLY